ncbi:haloacid dehalogenase type II [Halalkalicoccus salilacus]|uniref:haloacid dehalogenase type II n=1 Tax=Halalkalicoccus salilacus TaxID=3117459 RepID=UPI00300F1969
MDPETVTTITVDSYSTLVDVSSQQEVLEEYVDGIEDAEEVSRLWRHQYILYSVIANDIDEYRPFWELIGQGLRYALESHGHDVPADVRDEIRRTVYEDRIAVFEDVTDGIGRLIDAGYEVYVVSNGTPEMLEHLLEAANLDGVVTDAVSADEVETYKPDPAIYRHAAERTGTPIGEILHASGGGMRDVWGAKHAGMQTAWLSRPDKRLPREHLGRDPDVVVEDFHDLADRFE